MSTPVAPEMIAAIRELFFGRLTDTTRDINLTLTDIALQAEAGNHNAALALVAEVESRIHAMRTILIVFRECLEG